MSSDIPCTMVLRLIPRSPRRRIRLVTVIGGLTILREPGRARKTSADLTPATGARTTRLHRTLQRCSSVRLDRSQAEARPAIRHAPDAAASTASRPNVRDDGQRPSFGTGRLKSVAVICPTGQAKFFCEGEDWTTQISLNRLTKSRFWRTRFARLKACVSEATSGKSN